MASNWRRLKSLRRSTINIDSDNQVYCCVADVLRGFLLRARYAWMGCMRYFSNSMCICTMFLFSGRGSRNESSCCIDYGARCFPTPRLVRNRPRNAKAGCDCEPHASIFDIDRHPLEWITGASYYSHAPSASLRRMEARIPAGNRSRAVNPRTRFEFFQVATNLFGHQTLCFFAGSTLITVKHDLFVGPFDHPLGSGSFVQYSPSEPGKIRLQPLTLAFLFDSNLDSVVNLVTSIF
jgi:hypothetical protein